jgi:hypothetical protein
VSVRDAIYGLLTADDTLTDLLSSATAVYHQEAPTEADWPLVIFNRQTGQRDRAFAGEPMRPEVWLVKAVTRAHSASTAEAIDARLEALLDGAGLSITGSTLLYLRRTSDVQYPEQDGQDTYQHVGGLYRLVHQHD